MSGKSNEWIIQFNKKASEFSDGQVLKAYNYWLLNKNSVKGAAEMHNTSFVKLKKYIINTGYSFDTADYAIFNNIDNEEKAYWLGFIFADGCIASGRSNNIEISLQKSDVGHLEKFKHFISAKQNIVVDSFRCRICITNKNLKDSLIKLGCTPKKSLTLQFPKIENSLMRHFIRGYFDGDGCITRSRKNSIWTDANIACGSEDFIFALKKYLEEELDIDFLYIYRRPNSNTKILMVTDSKFKKLVNYMYLDCNIYLDRKFHRFENSIAVLSGNRYDYEWAKTVDAETPIPC